MTIGELPKLCAHRYRRKNATLGRERTQPLAVFNDRVNPFDGSDPHARVAATPGGRALRQTPTVDTSS